MYGRRPPSLLAGGGRSKRVRVSGLKFDIFFWLGLGLGYIMVCDVTLVCVKCCTLTNNWHSNGWHSNSTACQMWLMSFTNYWELNHFVRTLFDIVQSNVFKPMLTSNCGFNNMKFSNEKMLAIKHSYTFFKCVSCINIWHPSHKMKRTSHVL